MSTIVGDIIKGDLGEVVKWIAILILGVLSLVGVLLLFAFSILFLTIVLGIVAIVALKAIDKEAKPGLLIAIFFALVGIGALGGLPFPLSLGGFALFFLAGLIIWRMPR